MMSNTATANCWKQSNTPKAVPYKDLSIDKVTHDYLILKY